MYVAERVLGGQRFVCINVIHLKELLASRMKTVRDARARGKSVSEFLNFFLVELYTYTKHKYSLVLHFVFLFIALTHRPGVSNSWISSFMIYTDAASQLAIQNDCRLQTILSFLTTELQQMEELIGSGDPF